MISSSLLFISLVSLNHALLIYSKIKQIFLYFNLWWLNSTLLLYTLVNTNWFALWWSIFSLLLYSLNIISSSLLYLVRFNHSLLIYSKVKRIFLYYYNLWWPNSTLLLYSLVNTNWFTTLDTGQIAVVNLHFSLTKHNWIKQKVYFFCIFYSTFFSV